MIASAAIALSCSVLTANADVLYMKNGDRITGSIKRVWDGELFIESDYADEFAVSMDAVARIETDGIFEIELLDDREIAGRLATGESGTTVLITETRTVPRIRAISCGRGSAASSSAIIGTN